MIRIEPWLTDDRGARLLSLGYYVQLTAGRTVNQIGRLELKMPATFNVSILEERPDLMVQVWVSPVGGVAYHWHSYFIRRWKRLWEGNRELVALWGPGIKDVFRRRIVACYEGITGAHYTDYADDAIKQVVRDAKDDGITPAPSYGTRVWDDLSVLADVSQGPLVDQDVSWQPLLTLSRTGAIPMLADAAAEEGTPVFYEIVPDTITGHYTTWRFETTVDQPGLNASDRVILSPDGGNLTDGYWEYDATTEANYIYVGGKGEGTERITRQVYDAERMALSYWNRCEIFVDAPSEEDNDILDALGQEALQEGRPLERLGGIPLDTPGAAFGIHWDFGTRVTARYRGVERTPYVSAATLNSESGGVNVQAVLTYG